jgi:hypothetical protein
MGEERDGCDICSRPWLSIMHTRVSRLSRTQMSAAVNAKKDGFTPVQEDSCRAYTRARLSCMDKRIAHIVLQSLAVMPKKH